jgi:hypothetical protein
MSRRLGLIVGVNQYQDATFQPLQFAENDTRALAQWLVNDKGGKWSPADVQLVQGQHATRELIESLITQLCLNMTEAGDLALIYFAGHAFVDERNGEGYLALTNTLYQEPSTALHLLSFVRYITSRSRATHILSIIDCFQTGQAWRMRRTSPFDSRPLLGSTLLDMLRQQPNRLFLCSCRGNESAPEMGEQRLGLLAHRMIVGLCGPAADPATGDITLRRLHAYLFNVLGEQQRPQLFGQDQVPLVLVGTQTPPTAQPPAPSQSSPVFSSTPASTAAAYMGAGASPAAASVQSAIATAQPPPRSPQSIGTEPLADPAVEQRRQQQLAALREQVQPLLQMQNYPAALSLIEQMLQIAPDDSATLTLKGQVLGTVGRFPEALATVEQLLRGDANNAMAWSMRAVLLSNMGQYQDAFSSIERSLELDASNPETYAIKTTIMARVAEMQSSSGQQPGALTAASQNRGGPLSFFIGMVLQIAGLVMGITGLTLLIVLPTLPPLPGLALASFGLALLCVNAARGAYRYGFMRLALTFVVSILAGGILGAAYKIGYTKIITEINAHPSMLIPVLFMIAWLAIVATLPLLLAIGGFIGGFGTRRRKA